MGGQSTGPGHRAGASSDLKEALFDLKHDLGKYLYLPLAMLPGDAGPEAVLAAARKGLLRTRELGTGVRSAQQLWDAFREEWESRLSGLPGYARLAASVRTALAWRSRLGQEAEQMDRARVAADLKAVGLAVQELIEEVNGA